MRRQYYVLIALCLMVLSLPVKAQASLQGSLRGRVSDSNNATIAGVTLTLINTATGTTHTTTTDGNGEYQFPPLAPGSYKLTATRDGFQTFTNQRLWISTDTRFDIRLEPGTIREEIVVLGSSELSTATKMDVAVRDTPITGGAISQALIEQQGGLTLANLLRNVSGAHARVDYGLYQSLTFRGFSGDRDNVLLVDGIRNEGNRINTQLSHIERIEVLKGPASVLYGAEAFSGAVNLIRKRPSAEHHYEGSFSVGSFQDFRASLGATGGISDKLLYRFDVGGVVADQWRDTKPRLFNITPSLYWYPTSRIQFTLHYTFIRDHFAPDAGLPIVNGAVVNVPLDRRYNTPNDFALSRDHNLQFSFSYQVAERSELRNLTSIRRYDDEYFAAESQTVSGTTLRRSALYFLHERDPILNQLQYSTTRQWGVKHRFLAGWEYQYFPNVTDRSNFTPVAPIDLFHPVETQPAQDRLPTARFIRFRQHINALYGQDHIELTPRVKALVGMRYDIFRRWSRTDPVSNGVVAIGSVINRDLEALTGRAGLVYLVATGFSLYGSYGTAFRPNLQVPFDGRVLEPERGRQFEFGQRLEAWSGRLAWNAAFYHFVKRNVTFARMGNIFDQAGKVRSRGFETDLELRPASALIVTANYAFTDAKFEDFFVGTLNLTGLRPRYIPRHTANLWATKWFKERLGLAVGANYVGEMFSDNPNLIRLGNYPLADAAVFLRLSRTQFAINLNNLFNRRRYFNSSIYDFQLYPGAPFNALFTVRWKR